MSNFAIVADPASGLTKDLRDRFGIDDVILGHITFPDGTDHIIDQTWSEISPDDYYISMAKNKAIYKTGAPNPTDIAEKVEKYLAQGRDVLIITLSSGMSATYDMCVKTKEELEQKYPENKVCVVDSRRFSAPMILMNKKASEMRAEGASVEEVAKWLEENRNCFRQAGPMNDLKFLARTGRISGAKAFFGQLAGVNSLGDFAPFGVSTVLATIKGTDKAILASIEYIKQTIIDPEDQTIVISHSYREKEAEKLKELVQAEFNPKEIMMVRVDMLCGANVGPGMAAVYYTGKEATEDMAWEKETMQAIVEKLKK